jgi:hypothetical protein
MQPGVILSLLAVGFGSLGRAEEVKCWAPDGETLANNKTYVPCNKLGIEQQGVYSSCCQLDGEPDERDLCTTTGLCLRNNVVSRGYCTDKTWASKACVNVCGSDDDGGNSTGPTEITSCTDGTYCCGSNNLECCGTNRAFSIEVQGSVVEDEPDKEASSTFKNATIGLAAALGAVALLAAGVLFWQFRRNKSLRRQLAERTQAADTPATQAAQPYRDTYHYHPGSTASPTIATAASPGMSEFGQPKPPSRISEIHGESRYSELDGSNRHLPSPSPREANYNPSVTGSPLPSPGPYR